MKFNIAAICNLQKTAVRLRMWRTRNLEATDAIAQCKAWEEQKFPWGVELVLEEAGLRLILAVYCVHSKLGAQCRSTTSLYLD